MYYKLAQYGEANKPFNCAFTLVSWEDVTSNPLFHKRQGHKTETVPCKDEGIICYIAYSTSIPYRSTVMVLNLFLSFHLLPLRTWCILISWAGEKKRKELWKWIWSGRNWPLETTKVRPPSCCANIYKVHPYPPRKFLLCKFKTQAPVGDRLAVLHKISNH